MARLLIWRAGDVIREKLAQLGDDWQVARFAPPFCGVRGTDRLIDAAAQLPFDDDAFEAIYARRIIEHLAPDEADSFVRELRRTVAPGGIIRLSVPDTEELARAYLRATERARREASSEARRDVSHQRLLLIDQFVRRVPGGALAREIVSGRMTAETVRGSFGDALGPNGAVVRAPLPSPRPSLSQRLKERARVLAGRRWVTEPHATREAHLWIYDRFSLPKLLREAGFRDIRIVESRTSSIAGWPRWTLDLSGYGPHDFEPSLIVEASHG